MRIFVTSFWLSKAGNTPEEYEDAFYPKDGGERQEKILRSAVADGASEGMLSGKWAEILVKIFCRFEAPHADAKDFLERAYRAWDSWKRSYLHEREKRNKPIQWYEEPGLQAGAFSTFLGLMLEGLEEDQSGKWRAIAVGDSCVFQVRGENLITRFPIEHSSDFTNRPLLISSNPARNRDVPEIFKIAYGDWCVDDRFYLITDALACWFLREYESGQAPWLILGGLNTREQRQPSYDWIEELRTKKKIRNDDVTLIRIDV